MQAGLANSLVTGFLISTVSQRDRSLPTYGGGLIFNLSGRVKARVNHDLEIGDFDRIEAFKVKTAVKF
ncbi:hypothetical protein [Sphingomicrobium aestuariivivum]|uniref:hypothetical protein n=1 Tax=Sphingomicrobium aestuariivivum TaxID=1582356 RepID=UPI001FD6850A|nr:hypothetical protein [Sphingomicrobium aestuariivivum]MCJ8192040.1 hypothetical protein [Sphingomicrobium aestuariivivum]